MKRIFSFILALMAVQIMWAAQITVTNTSDDVEEEGSLRWACKTATANDTIVFKFSTKGDKTIHISSSLSTKASIDGSTWADSIIIDGYDEEKETYVNYGVDINSRDVFVKNIIVQNFFNGIRSIFGYNIFQNCIARNCRNAGIMTSTGDSFIRCVFYKNGRSGLYPYMTSASINKVEYCEFYENKYGIDYNIDVKYIKWSNFLDNVIGLIVNGVEEEISNCVISGNDSIGLLNNGYIPKVSDNIIGLSADQRTAYPNGIGLYHSGTSKNGKIESFTNNVVSGNRYDGIIDISMGGFGNFTGNYIGTNKYFDQYTYLGNGGDGLKPNVNPRGYYGDFSYNYFGNNGGYGFMGENLAFDLKIEKCYFGITPDGQSMPNGKGGLKWGSNALTLNDCHIGYNEGIGLDFCKQGLRGDLQVYGGKIVYNKNSGIVLDVNTNWLEVVDVVFDSNGESAIALNTEHSISSLISGNKFLHTNKAYPAFKTTDPYPVPEFTSCKMTKTTIVIEGKIDTAAIAKIELFYTSQGEQTAEMLVDSFYTNPDGTFSDTLDRSMFVGKSVISFNATATYGKITSPLSDLVSPSLGRVDLASTEFYVKMDGYGDGSSWENAMNLQTFIYYLPQVMNGSTFYVAEGRYVPTSKGFKINSSVSIVGGFSPDATSGAVADPVRYKTVFTGDPSGDDTVVEDQYLSDPSNDDVIFSEFDGHLFTAGNFDVHISGCELSGTRSSINRVSAISCGNLYLTNCTFEKTGMINGPDKKKVVADGCIFRNLIKGYTPSGLFEQDSVYVNNSVFENLQGLASTCFDRSLSIVDIRNSIFKNIKNGKSIFYSTKNVYLYNNLFVGVSQVNNETNFLLVKDTAVIIGNIFKDCDYENLVNTTDHTFIKHNLCEKILGTDDDINTGDLADFVVDGVYNKTTGTFVPTYSDWGGYVPTIVTKSDTLPDGRSIRFSLNETKVLTDQRGVSRLPETCMGAYEIGCGSDTTIATEADTINVGGKIYGQTFTKVGVHDSIFETLQTAMGCDSVVMHKVVVKPTALNYYVKRESVNKGDGSDWDNAMDEKGFLTYLPLAPEGATFHVAAGDYLRKTDKLKSISVSNDVTIIGGYPANATKGAASDPKKYSTNISLFKQLTSDNDAVKVQLYNLTFTDLSIIMNTYSDFTLIADKCKFYGYGSVSYVFYTGNKSVVKLTDSYFSGGNNPITSVGGTDGYIVEISGCTFEHYNNPSSFLINISSPTNISLTNSTIVGNKLKGIIGGGSTHTNVLLNNTIVGNKLTDESFHMMKQPPVFEGNIYAENGYEFTQTFSNTNIYNKKVSDILEGTLDETTDVFTPELKDNGGFTPTVALKSDKLSDGKSVRFPRLKNVLTDQRGVSRLTETCMGAYEIGCGSDTTFSTDTINVGTKIYGQTFTKVGVHDSIFETLQNAMGCDSVVMHKVVVKPDPTKLNYYVKMNKENDGDGRDWDNAMSGEDFATYLPLAPDGATFYVAAGTYKPVYDVNMNIPSDLSDLCYAINSSVTIRGGYPADAKGKDVPSEPDKYRTIFSGDLGDNFNTGIQTLFLTAKEKLFSIYGLNFVKTKDVSSSSAAIISNGNFIVNQCVFDSCFCAILLKNSSSAFIDSCLFTKSWAPSINVSEEASLTVSNSKFEDNVLFSPSRTPVYCGAAIYSQGIINVDKCIFENNKVGMNGYSTSGGGAIAIVTNKNNSHIKHSYFKNNSATHGGSIYLLNGDSISIDGCTFVDNYTLLGLGNAIYSTARGNNTLYKCLSNNTFYKNDDREYFSSTNVIDGNDITHVVNNTFVNNHVPCFNLGKTLIEGNIIVSDTTIGRYLGVLGESNLVSDNISVDGVISVPISEFGVILDGVYDLNNNTFIPTLADNGGFTPTVALKSDKLSDGRSIRFPRLENVLTDQRGVERLDSTCMGAYELGCVNDTTFSTDTINVGTKIYGQTFTKVGVHDSIFETLKDARGCDSVVMYRVVVKPDPKTFNYYVKMDKEGRGDGSDWDNAMDSTDFATYLPLAPDGATFYVAAGTYKPIYDVNMNIPSNSSNLCYAINSSVTIRGGYPADAKGKDVPSEPKKYETVFDGDIKGDDVIDKSKAEDGYTSLERSNLKDNVSNMFFSNASIKQNVEISGVVVKNTATYAYYFVSGDKKLVLRKDSCAYTAGIVNMPIVNANLEVYSCGVLSNVADYVFNIPTISKIILDSVNVIDSRCSSIVFAPSCKTISVSNSRFENSVVGNNGFYAGSEEGTELKLQNVIFENNRGSLAYLYQSTNVYIDSCSFLKNKYDYSFINASLSDNNVIALSKSKFEQNDFGKLLDVFADSILTKNCVFENNNIKDVLLKVQTNSNNKLIQIEESSFANNSCETYLLNTYADSVAVVNSIFENNTSSSLWYDSKGGGKRFYLNNAFINNTTGTIFSFSASVTVSRFVNNTITKNTVEYDIFNFGDDPLYLYNNTIVGNIVKNKKGALLQCDFYHSWADLYGNIIVGNSVPEGKSEYLAIRGNSKKRHNILSFTLPDSVHTDFSSGNCHEVPDETNIISVFDPTYIDCDNIKEYVDKVNKNPGALLSEIFEGTYDKKTNLFTPKIGYYGGLTPTIALRTDRLSDGTPIRFPIEETIAETDQRGVERFDSTCMGAYEMRCSTVETVLKDTVMVGDSYTFIDKNLEDVCQKVGSYHFTETLKSAEGCDSIVKLSLAVRPQKNENGYYVKEDGTGDGSDWNNAMSPKDFAEYLPLVYDGETFHIAAGTYKSTYVDPELGRMYNINSSVTLIGGYPDTVTSTSTPSMPDVYVTKLTADVKGNDYTYYYPNSLDYTPYSNVKDNDSILIRVNGAKTLNLFGMTLSGVNSCDRGAVDLADGASLVMDRCFVQDNVASGVYGKGVDVKVTNSVFTHNYSNNGAAFNLADSKLNVQSTAVYENRAKVEECESEYAMGGVANLENTEATFENSTLSNNAADMGSVFSVKSSKLDLTNNTIVGNQIIPESKHKGSVIGSLDDKSTVSLFGNIVIGNQNGEVDGVVNVASSDYNVFSYKTDMSYGSHDMVMNDPKEVQMLLDGDFAFESETVFIPNIQYNGGYTPTVAVIQSAFDGGKILNIPLDDRKVTYDQRGFVRKDSSCIGAFEFPTFMGYYVKKQAHGDGSGRDWENSMDDTTFAKYFPIVPTSASFHVAEGVYTPMFDSYGKLTESKSRCYSTSRLVNIYGGYPDSAQTGCVADPTKYKTILSVDFNGDDKYVESADEYSCIDALNTSDNGYSILGIVSKVPGWIEIKGIDFRGQRCVPRASSSAVQVSSGNIGGVNIRIEKCSFIGDYAAIYSGCDSTIIEECLFDSLDYSGLSVSSFSSSENNYLFVDKSTFANSLYHLSPYSFKGEMRVQNSTFANTLYGVYTPSGYAVTPENTKVELYNNSFFSGKKEKKGLLIYDFVPVELKGNIISSKKLDVKPDPNGKYESNVIVSDYNVYTTEIDAYPLGENDTIVPQSSIGEIVKGVVENDIFEASLEDEGLYVKKLPTLINVKFEKGGGIKKMQKNATPVTDDQIGEIRSEVDYCVGAIEADCEFKKANFKLELAEEEICRDDTAKVTLTGLTKKEKATYKFAWTSSKDSVYVVDTFGNPGSFHVYARQALVPLQMTITNVCGVDTVLEIMQKVNGVGSVPFDGIEEGEVFCQNESEPVKLTTAVEGAIFTGECVVKKTDGYYFDASKAKGDSTRVRCSIQDGDCRSFDEKTIHFFKFDGDEAVEILASTQTKNVCMEKPQAQSVFTVTGWRDGLTCRLNGLASTLMDSTVTKDSVLTVTYGSLKNGEYIFVVSDECKPIASETIKIENEEIDPDMLKLSLDTVVANTQTCDGGEFGDVRVEYSGNINKADVVVVLSSLGTMVKSDTLSEEEAFVVFDNLKPAVYDVKIFFEGMEDCTIGDANYSRTVDVTKPVKFEVAFTATQAICENSIDAMMFTKTSGGNTPYTYKWTKYVGDIATSTVSHTKALHDTLPDLVKNEVYLCDVVDNYGCAASSDTLKIIYDHADSTLVDTFIYDPYQRCKGINNAQMIVDFDVVSEYAHPVYSLKEWNDKEYSEIDKNDADPALNKILLGALAPGKYKLHVGYPSVGCPALIDTTVEIKELVNDFKFEPADSIRMPRCYADNDAAIYFRAIGASRGLTATFSYKSNGKTLYKLSIDSLAGDTAYFVADNLPNDSFVVKMKNVCGEEITYEYNVGAPGFGIEMIDSISFKMLKCRYDSTGIIAFHINTGDYDSTKVTLRYSKPEEVIYVYDDTTYTTVDVPVYKIEPRVKDTIWNADSTDFDVRYERDPETNEIIIDTFVTYEKKDTMIIKKKNKPGIRYVEAVFPCKFDTVYGKDTTFIYSGLPGGGYFIDLVSTIKGCKDSVRIKDTIKIPNPVILSHEVLDISCKSKTDGVISLKPIRSGGRDRTFVLKHDSTFKDGKYEYEMCYIGYLIDGPSTVNGIGQEVKKKEFVNYEYDGCPLMTSLNRISNEAHLYKKDGDSYTQIQRYDIINPEKNLKRFLFGEEWKSIKWTKQDATGNYMDFTIVTPDSTTYEEDVYYSGPDPIKTAVWSYTHLPNFWKDEFGEWLESGVQTIANLSKGVYQCVVTDSNDCVYSTKISVVEPKDPLRIEEVTYDAEGALCDPTKRHIDMKVKGGWGDYNYMVMDGKNEGKGGLIDNYLAATSITYDTLNAMGVYRSQFLDPGKYRVAVVDGKGCRIEFEDEIEVKTYFTVDGSVKDAVCPGEESADATFVIHDDAEKKYKYAVKEHIGSCETPYDCVDDLNFVDCKVDFVDDGMTFTKKITGGGHGFFIYRLDTNGDTTCGTYVRVSAVDTLKPMTLSKKSITHVTCNGSANGEIELYVLGGKAPYIVDVNPSWGSDVIDQRIENLYPEVDPTDTMGKFPRIIIKNLKARDYYFTITDSNKCHQRFGDTAIHTAKLTVKEPDALTAEFGASSMCANAGAADDPNYGSVFAQDVKGGTAPYLFSVTGGLEVKRELDGGNVEYYHESVDSDDPFIPVAGYKETEFHYTIEDSMGCQISKTLMFGQEEIKSVRQKEFLATTWSHYGDVIALIDFCGPESTFDSVSYKFSNEKVKMLDKRLYIYDLDNPKRGATPNAKNIVLSYHDTREVPDGFFIENFNMVKDMTPLLAAHINFVAVTDKSDLYKSTSHDANDSLYLKTDVIMSSYFKGCRYQVEINDFLKVAYDNVELYYGGVDKRKNILDIVVNPNPRTEDKPCTVNVYFADNTEDCVLSFYHMDGSEIDRVTIHAGDLKVTKYDHDKAYVYTYNVEDDRFNNVEVVVISAMTNHDSKGSFLLNASSVGQ